MTGWKEHSSQQKAKRRGSATVSFSDIRKEFGSNQDWNFYQTVTGWHRVHFRLLYCSFTPSVEPMLIHCVLLPASHPSRKEKKPPSGSLQILGSPRLPVCSKQVCSVGCNQDSLKNPLLHHSWRSCNNFSVYLSGSTEFKGLFEPWTLPAHVVLTLL